MDKVIEMNDKNGATVLLVDDEENVLRSLERVLRKEPYKIVTATSGKEGLAILCNMQVQLIVSDQRMEGMTGIEFLESARDMCPETVRILLTGYSDLKTVEEAINRVEIYRFLNKPWNEEDLKSTIRQGLAKWKLKKENERLFRIIEKQNQRLRQYNEKLEQMVEQRTLALKEAQSQLIQSEKMASLGVLAGGVAHEINNPLGGILGITQLLLMKYPDNGELGQDLKTIEQAGLHCSKIVKNLLSFSRKSDPSEREPVVITDLIKQIIMLTGHLFRHNNIELRKEFPSDFPALMVNTKQLQQVMVNLLVNAQQSMNRGGVVCVRGCLEETGEVTIEVEDQGSGIPDDIINKIFDPFFTTKEEGAGTGLGLSVCYRIVQEHGGRIEVDTEPGKGTCMKVILPDKVIAPSLEKKPVLSGGAAATGRIQEIEV
jgi:signal transduction histidine kinase